MRIFLSNAAITLALAGHLTVALAAGGTSDLVSDRRQPNAENEHSQKLPPPPIDTIPPANAPPKELPPRALIICPACTKELLDEVVEYVFVQGGTVSILLPPEGALVRVAPSVIPTLAQKFGYIAIFASPVGSQQLPADLQPDTLRFVSYWNRSLLPPATETIARVGPPTLTTAEGPSGEELRTQIAEELLHNHESIRARAPSAVQGASLTIERFLSALQRRDATGAEEFIAFGTDGAQPRALLPRLLDEAELTAVTLSDFSIRAVALSAQQITVQLVTSGGLPTAELALRPYGLSWKIVEINP